MDSDVLMSLGERLLTEKRTSFRKVSEEQLSSIGYSLPHEGGFVLPGSKSALNHQIFLIFQGCERIVVLAYSPASSKGLEEQEALEDTAQRLSERETWGTWLVLRTKDRVALVLKGGLTVGAGDLKALLWSTCGLVDAAFKTKERELKVDMPEPNEAQMQGLVKQLLSKVGFRKIKEMTLARSLKAFLVVLSNESDSVEDCWKRFPMRFEVDKAGIVTLRVFLSVHDKAHVFEKGLSEAAMSVAAQLNTHIPEGWYVYESAMHQVHLIFKLACSKLQEDGIRALLQNYYEAAISIYKWSAWSFVQLVLQHPQDNRRFVQVQDGDIEALMEKGLERSPSERKCVVLNYSHDPELFKRDWDCLALIQATPALAGYLLLEPFLVCQQDFCIKVFVDTLLRPLEAAFQEGMSAGMFLVRSFFDMMRQFEVHKVFPSLSMLKFRPSPLRLLLIPAKGFSRTPTSLYSDFQSLVIHCTIAAEQELTLTPDVSLLYFSPDSFQLVARTDTGPQVKSLLAGDSYLLWRMQISYLTRRIVNYVEGYRAEARLICGENTVEGIVATEDDRFEMVEEGNGEEMNRFYLLEQHHYTSVLPSETRDFATVRCLVHSLASLHRKGLFHGLISPGTVRKIARGKEWEFFLCMPCLHWKYVEILYPVVPAAYLSYLAPEMTLLYHTSQYQSFEILQSCDVYSFARLLQHWLPQIRDYPIIQAAQAMDWRERPGLEQVLKEVEEGLDRSTLSTGAHQDIGECDKMLESL